MGILYAVLIGAVAGWLAGKIMKGGGFGTLVNVLLGIGGGIVGSRLFRLLEISIGNGVLNDLVTGVVGAIGILFVAGLFKDQKRLKK